MKYGICAIIKNEQRYLEEWIVHNLNIGFSEIHLYEDTGSESHLEITKKYSNVFLHPYSEDIISKDYFERDKKQVDLFNFFVNKFKFNFDWIAFIDPDEYIRFDENYNLERLCTEFSSFTGIMLQQKTYGASGHISRPTGGVQENYTSNPYSYRKSKFNMKTIVNCNKNICFKGVHKIDGAIFTNGINKRGQYDCYDKAWYDHYYTKSWEDWMERFTKRGDVIPGNVKIGEFFSYNLDLEEKLLSELPLVFDVGCNNGDDSKTYLELGCKVVGVECSPKLCEYLEKKFFGLKRFILDTRCITSEDNKEVIFYLSNKDIWNSCNKYISERQEKAKEIKVKTVTLQSLFDKYGLPEYCKIDIEGNDIIALESIKTTPNYISCESECIGSDGKGDPYLIIDKLYDLGYRKFKLIDQRTNELVEKDNSRLKLTKSMPWGLPGEWLNYTDTRLLLKSERNSHVFKNAWDFWYDIYAKL